MNTIYFEGLALVEGHFSGVGQYTLGILRGVDIILEEKKLSGAVTPMVYVIIPYDTVARFQSFGFKHITYKTVPFSFRIMSGLWHRDKMPPLDVLCGKGYYIFTRFVGMPLLFSKSAIVIYDISYELFSQYSDERNIKFLSRSVKKYVKKADRIITISKNAKKEIVDFYKVPEKKVVIATPGIDQTLLYKRSPKEIAEVKKKYKIDGDYILALSNLEPRKNLDGLVDAYCSLPKDITDTTGLFLVGVNGWKFDGLFGKIIDKVKQGYNIMRPSHYVTDEDKPAIISGAKLLVYPSHYEGFGMPPLEALACGTPVITADNSSLPEVVGKVGTMVKSTDTKALARAIEDSLDIYPELAKKIAREGPKQAEKFSWKESAQKIIDTAQGNIE
jgi:glycosyltransferase involved in cell wall biosynthesis